MSIIVAVTLLTAGAACFALLSHRLKLPLTLAYLVFGMVLAPFSDRIFASRDEAESLAEIGVILLMFTAGLGIDKSQVQSMLRLFVGGGLVQVFLVATAVGTGAWLLGCGWAEAVVVGLMLACSSTAVILKAYEETGESDSHKARTTVAVSLFQDILVVVVLGMLPLLKALSSAPDPAAGQESQGLMILQLVGLPVVGLPLLYIVSNWVLPRLFTRLVALRNKEIFSLLSLGCCLVIALAASYTGGSTAIGAFMGGLVLARTPFAAQIMGELQVVRDLGLGLFFIMIGLLVDMKYAWANAPELLICFALFLLVKSLFDTAALRIFRLPLAIAASAGIALAQVSELAFVLGSHATDAGILQPGHYQFVITLAVISMLSSPFLVRLGNFAERSLRRHPLPQAPVVIHHPTVRPQPHHGSADRADGMHPPVAAAPAAADPSKGHVVVVGYGPVGRMIVDKLLCDGYRPLVVDLNHHSITEVNHRGLSGIYGDAGNTAVMLKAGVERAETVFITIPDLTGRTTAIHVVRQLNPQVNIFTRARYLGEQTNLEAAGATRVFFEEREVALAMTEILECQDSEMLCATLVVRRDS